MKYCPTCSRTYEDDTASFCQKDATPLVDALSPSQLSVTMLPDQSAQTMAPGNVARGIKSQNLDSFITPAQVSPVKKQEAMPSSESGEVDSQNPASAGVSDQPRVEGTRLVFDLSRPAAPAEKSQPSPQSKPQPASQPKSQLKSKSARKRHLLLLAIVGAAVLSVPAGIFLWWQHYKTTPAYDLALLVDAIHRNDSATFNKIIAMDKITDTFASQVTQNVLSQNTSATESDRKQLDSSLTRLSPNMKQMVRDEVEKQIRDEATPSQGESFLMIALTMPYKMGIMQTGDTATVTPKVHAVEWTMQRSSDGLWTVIAVKDDVLASQIMSQTTKELPTIAGEKDQTNATQKNAPLLAQQKSSAGNSRAKKKERKTRREGITIELRRIPWPE